MPNPNVTIRHARSAIHLVISGAIRDIEAEFSIDEGLPAITEMTEKLFDEVADELSQWEVPGTVATRLDAMLCEMQAELTNVPAYRAILAKHDLLP